MLHREINSVLAPIDCFILALALSANCIVLWAVIKSRFRMIGYRRFLISLTAGDIYMCFVNGLALVQLIFEPDKKANLQNNNGTYVLFIKCGANFIRTLKISAFYLNLLNLCGMSFDNLIGVTFPMKYTYYMDSKAARYSPWVIWVFSLTIGLLDVPINMINFGDMQQPKKRRNGKSFGHDVYDIFANFENDDALFKVLQSTYDVEVVETDTKRNTTGIESSFNTMLTMLGDERLPQMGCPLFKASRMWNEMCVVFLVVVSFVFLAICYSITFKKVSFRMPSSTLKTHRAKIVATSCMFIGAFMTCWFPFLTHEFYALLTYQNSASQKSWDEKEQMETFSHSMIVGYVLNSILMMYPLIDPIIYAVRITLIKQFLLTTFCCHRYHYESNSQSFYGTTSTRRATATHIMDPPSFRSSATTTTASNRSSVLTAWSRKLSSRLSINERFQRMSRTSWKYLAPLGSDHPSQRNPTEDHPLVSFNDEPRQGMNHVAFDGDNHPPRALSAINSSLTISRNSIDRVENLQIVSRSRANSISSGGDSTTNISTTNSDASSSPKTLNSKNSPAPVSKGSEQQLHAITLSNNLVVLTAYPEGTEL